MKSLVFILIVLIHIVSSSSSQNCSELGVFECEDRCYCAFNDSDSGACASAEALGVDYDCSDMTTAMYSLLGILCYLCVCLIIGGVIWENRSRRGGYQRL